MPSTFTKDPSAVLDYVFDWDAWLEAGETISTHTITPTTGITVDSSSIAGNGKSVTVWLSGGTANATYYVTCTIVTTEGRVDERTAKFLVVDR